MNKNSGGKIQNKIMSNYKQNNKQFPPKSSNYTCQNDSFFKYNNNIPNNKNNNNNNNNINYSNEENYYKDSLESNNNISKGNILIPDSLENTKISIYNNNNNNTNTINNKETNFLNFTNSFSEEKTKDNSSKHKSKQDSLIDNNNNKKETNNNNNNNQKENDEETTKKIDYKYITNYPLKNIQINTKKTSQKKFFWFAAYNKLIKKKNLLQILNYYSNTNINKNNLKEKMLLIKEFQIYYFKKKFYIKQNKNEYIFVKLYYLSLEQFNYIFNYLNKIDFNINDDLFNFNNDFGSYQILKYKNKIFPYSYLICLGTYYNVNIYTFTNFNLKENLMKFPKIEKISKLSWILLKNFPKYSIEFFINYLIGYYNHFNIQEKINEIKKYAENFYLKKNKNDDKNKIKDKSLQSINIKNVAIKNNNNNYCNITQRNNTFSKENNNRFIGINLSNNNKYIPKLKNKNNNNEDSNIKIRFSTKSNGNYINSTNLSKNLNITNNSISNKISKNLSSNSTSYKIKTSNNAIYSNNNNNSINNKNNNNKNNLINTKESKNSNIYVVERKNKADIDFDFDDESSIELKKKDEIIINDSKIYKTPKNNNKQKKYYS